MHYQSITQNGNGSWLVIHICVYVCIYIYIYIYIYIVFFVALKKTEAFDYHV